MPLVAISLFAMSNNAVAKENVTCREFAQAATDEWAAGFMDRAAAATEASAEDVVIISYGKKYIMPRQGVDSNLRLISVGDRIRMRHRVYNEEFARCMRAYSINVVLGQ